MKRMWLLLIVFALPMTLRAQRQSCDLGNSRQAYSVASGSVIYLSGPVFVCDNGTRITADSGVYVQSTGRVDFMGNVRFTEAERSLTSQYAQYIGRERRLMAQQNVVLSDKVSGTMLRAISLDYYQKSPSNADSRIEVYSGRPHATVIKQRKGSNAVDTTNVDADRIQIVAEKTFRGWGGVDVNRGKLKSRSAYAEFDQDGNYMRLYGRATVQSDSFKVTADSIDADLVNGDTFRELRARIDARIESNNVDVAAPVARVSFNEGLVERLIAMGGAILKKPALAQARIVSPDFILVADSIDAMSPGQKLESMIAVGDAAFERTPDSLDAKLPGAIARDWVRGDTVQAFFATLNPDTARVLERIVAKGAPAKSAYRLKEKPKNSKTDAIEVSVNYLTALMIDVVLKDGAVDVVHAEGDIHGVYLQKPPKPGTEK